MQVPIRSSLDFVLSNPVHQHDGSALDLSHASTEVTLLIRQRGAAWGETPGDSADMVDEFEATVTVDGEDQEAVAEVPETFWVDEDDAMELQWERRWRVVDGATSKPWYSPEWERFTVS